MEDALYYQPSDFRREHCRSRWGPVVSPCRALAAPNPFLSPLANPFLEGWQAIRDKLRGRTVYLGSCSELGTSVPVAVNEAHFALGRVLFPEPDDLPPTDYRLT